MKTLRLSTLAALLAAGAAQATDLTIDARAFQTLESSLSWAESSAGSLYCTGPIGVFEAQVPLPPNARIRQFAIWGGDQNNALDAQANLLRVCQDEFTASAPTYSTIASADSNGAGGAYFDATTLDITASDTNRCIYVARVDFGNGCASNVTVAKVRVRYTDDVLFADGFD
jgi:hypothetical protein